MNQAEELEAFRIFNERGGKFRLAIVNVCNLDCFFCHNEAMPNPRRGELAAGSRHLDVDRLAALVNAFARLGGRQVNLTGGEPLAHPGLFELLEKIEKRDTKIVLNTNALLANRLADRPRDPTIDAIFASLHTTDDRVYRESLGGGSATKAMKGISTLKAAGYEVQINYSLGPYNLAGFDQVLDFAVGEAIDLKAIALVRPREDPGFYGGEWIDPAAIGARLEARGAVLVGESAGLGGHTTTYRVGQARVKVKNIARGRLETDYCRGCLHKAQCGEGIYGLRVGVDGVMRPCLLRREKFTALRHDADYEAQILKTVAAMVGDWRNARFVVGAPA